MPLSLGGLIIPASLIALFLKLKGPAQTFMAAGALSPETARRPASVGVHAEYLIAPLVRSGLLIAAGDGRYYANAAKIRRRALLLYGFCGALAAIGAAFLAVAWLRAP
jgi:hypothetical protein